MPKQGQSVETCIITQWYKNKGDKVEKGDLLFAYETDKAAFEEESPVSGILLEIFFNEGDEVPVLENVAMIGQEGESIADLGNSDKSGEPEKPVVKEEQTEDERVRISPRAKALARDKNIDIASLKGSGPNGRIIVRDVEKSKAQSPTPGYTRPERPEERVRPDSPVSGDDFEVVQASNIRKIIARNMEASLQNSAQLTHHLSADARKILKIRKKIKQAADEGSLSNITLNDIVCYSVVRALKKEPEINAHFLGDTIRKFKKVHLGIAVDTDRGLMVPVLKNADDFSLEGLSVRLKELVNQCKAGKIDPELLASEQGSFTVSNLGYYGIELFTPVLNLPQGGILGVNTIQYQPRDLGEGTIGFVPVIGLSLTYDHRLIDGASASRFLKTIKDVIENFENDLFN